MLARFKHLGDTAEANRSCCRPTIDGFRPPDSKTDDAKNEHPKHTQNGPPKTTVFGPQKRKRAHKSPPAPGSADLIPSRDAVRTDQPPGKPMRHSWVCPGVGALRFHGPGPHPLKNTSRNPQEPPGAHFRQPVADRRGRNRVLLQRPTLRTSCLNIRAVGKF